MENIDIGFIIFIGVMFLVVGMAIGTVALVDINLDQEVADDICKQLTGDQTAVAERFYDKYNKPHNKLICKLPTFDSTQNIIFKLNSEEDIR